MSSRPGWPSHFVSDQHMRRLGAAVGALEYSLPNRRPRWGHAQEWVLRPGRGRGSPREWVAVGWGHRVLAAREGHCPEVGRCPVRYSRA